MGFTTGFTGGLTLTLSIAYLGVLAHQRNRAQQGEILRANAHLLNTLSAAPGTPPLPPPPTRAELAAAHRAHLLENAKEAWNAEVAGAVRWAGNTDWRGVREGLEDGVGRLWGRAFGDGEAVEARVGGLVGGVVEEGKRDAAALERKAAPVRAAVEERVASVKSTGSSALQRGVEKGREVVGKAKATVGLVEEKMKDAVLPVTDVEKAMRQRYETSTGVMSRSVEEALKERYTPVERRDQTTLRGI